MKQLPKAIRVATQLPTFRPGIDANLYSWEIPVFFTRGDNHHVPWHILSIHRLELKYHQERELTRFPVVFPLNPTLLQGLDIAAILVSPDTRDFNVFRMKTRPTGSLSIVASKDFLFFSRISQEWGVFALCASDSLPRGFTLSDEFMDHLLEIEALRAKQLHRQQIRFQKLVPEKAIQRALLGRRPSGRRRRHK